MLKKYFPYLIIFAALLASFTGSFFSIWGLGKLFGGHQVGATLLAFSFEFGNIIAAASLKLYWKFLPRELKYPLILVVIILTILTSMGIYGYLSDGYQKTALKDEIVQKRSSLVEIKKNNFQKRLDDTKKEIESINISLTELSKGYNQNTQTQQLIKGQVVTNVIVGNKKGLEQQMNLLNQRKQRLDSLTVSFLDSIQRLEIQIIELNQNNESNSELGPLKYLSTLINKPMNEIVNYLILTIVIVFQPLALMLILTSMFAFKNNHYLNRGSKRKLIKEENKVVNFKERIKGLFPVKNNKGSEQTIIPKSKRKYIRKPKVEIEKVEEPTPIEEPIIDVPTEESKVKPKRERKPKITDQQRKVVDNNLTPEIANAIAQSLKKGKLSHEQKRVMSSQQIEQFEKENGNK